jgi:glycosyltransferase involved in cell wall biosynthesis
MNKKPNVSVIILNYNAEQFLRETLQSVEMQKNILVETIVVTTLAQW